VKILGSSPLRDHEKNVPNVKDELSEENRKGHIRSSEEGKKLDSCMP
jgi:hypothetical protein